MAHATQSDVRGIATRTIVAVALVVGAAVVGNLLAAGAVVGVAVGLGDIGDAEVLVLSLLASEVGYLVVALGFLWRAGGRSFVPVDFPGAAEIRVGTLALLAAVAVEGARQLAVELTALGAAGTLPVGDDVGTTALAVVVAITVLLAPPVEEFLFRGVVQRYVHEVSSAGIGIAVATLLFVPVHGIGIALTASNVPGALAAIGTIAVVSVVLGSAYARTENLAVPIAVHVGYNLLTVVLGIAIGGI